MSQQPFENVVVRREASLLSTHKVLRNTYLLLSLTLLFSAAMAGIAMATAAPVMSPILVLVGYIGLLLLTTAMRNSPLGILCVFAFTGFMGWTLGPMLTAYIAAFSNGAEIVFTALGATGLIFFALSAYVLVTRKDFSFLGGFLFVGLLLAVIASIAGIFFAVPALQLAVSCAVVLIASGLILFDTSRIIHNGETNYIMATIALYLDIYMLFVNLLQILGALSGDR
ncbi:MAG: Bax inhibitor-1/YccA family protein [Legionellales bacterium]|nr:Bax inhibitor-1/YccA family protein [Legionellales bacterium]